MNKRKILEQKICIIVVLIGLILFSIGLFINIKGGLCYPHTQQINHLRIIIGEIYRIVLVICILITIFTKTIINKIYLIIMGLLLSIFIVLLPIGFFIYSTAMHNYEIDHYEAKPCFQWEGITSSTKK